MSKNHSIFSPAHNGVSELLPSSNYVHLPASKNSTSRQKIPSVPAATFSTCSCEAFSLLSTDCLFTQTARLSNEIMPFKLLVLLHLCLRTSYAQTMNENSFSGLKWSNFKCVGIKHKGDMIPKELLNHINLKKKKKCILLYAVKMFSWISSNESKKNIYIPVFW